jgi:ubiquinone/menaquinone biosynthesis C-methylase UbiE/uncharacterized protein YbaR (Trm112 family)
VVSSFGGTTPVRLVCPRDHGPLIEEEGALRCGTAGHRYQVTHGLPVLLLDDVDANHPAIDRSRAGAAGIGEPEAPDEPGTVDPYVQQEIVHTNGLLYRGLKGKLRRYPIPDLPLGGGGGGRLFLDLGCNWGRWCVAAERAGFRAVGIDPDLAAIEAARRVSATLGVEPQLVVGDARHLPFPDATFDVVYSYSVLQHFSGGDLKTALHQAARVLRPGGTMLIQMANILGLKQLANQARDLVRRERGVFRVRRWLPGQLLQIFRDAVGPATLRADGYFTLNPQLTDLDLLPPLPRLVVHLSSTLCRAATLVPPLRYLADSVFIEARKPE